jgi:hypothetical protein
MNDPVATDHGFMVSAALWVKARNGALEHFDRDAVRSF